MTFSTDLTKGSKIGKFTPGSGPRKRFFKATKSIENSVSLTTRPVMSITSSNFFEKIKAHPENSVHVKPLKKRLLETRKKSLFHSTLAKNSKFREVNMLIDSESFHKNARKTFNGSFNRPNNIKVSTLMTNIDYSKKNSPVSKAKNRLTPKPVTIQNKKLVLSSVKYFRKNKTCISKESKKLGFPGKNHIWGNDNFAEEGPSVLKCHKM